MASSCRRARSLRRCRCAASCSAGGSGIRPGRASTFAEAGEAASGCPPGDIGNQRKTSRHLKISCEDCHGPLAQILLPSDHPACITHLARRPRRSPSDVIMRSRSKGGSRFPRRSTSPIMRATTSASGVAAPALRDRLSEGEAR